MLSIRDLKFDVSCLGCKLLVDVTPVYEYKDNERTDRCVGYRYIVVLPEMRYERLGVRVDGKQLMEKPEDYAVVEFTGLELNAYDRDGRIQISAKATGIQLAEEAKKQS